jgi:uncharacterized metal-binding protein
MSEAEHKAVIAACYGASNTGQLAGAVATELAMENEAYSLVCLPAVAIDKATGLDKVLEAGLFIIVEGCPVMCCTEIVDRHTGRKPDIRVEMVEDYDIKKSPSPTFDVGQKDNIKQDVLDRVAAWREARTRS